MAFLFQAQGFRGKARFVLILCCTCEGSQTNEKSNFGMSITGDESIG
jgi:hypothetical protein